MRVFTGYDPRETAGWHAFVQSLIETSKGYELMPPLCGSQRDGTNRFTYERFTLFDGSQGGPGLYVDGADMLLRAPIEELFDLYEPCYAVQVVKHDYKTKHARKYVGTEMEAENTDYDRKNWSSVMLMNLSHWAHWHARFKIKEAIEQGNGKYLHRFEWLDDNEIGELPIEWGWMPQEYGENPKAKLLHYTIGGPFFKHYENDPMSQDWHDVAKTLHSER